MSDCFRRATARAYGIPYDLTPATDPFAADWQDTWERWARENGLRWWSSDEVAPIGVSRWIACVPSRTHAGAAHAVVMAADRLLYDPVRGSRRWTKVRPQDIVEAHMLLRQDSPIWDAQIAYTRIRGRSGLAVKHARRVP